MNGPPSRRPVEALLVIDLQRAFVSGDDAVPDAARVLDRARDLLARARSAGALVVPPQNDGLPGSADAPHTPGGRARGTGHRDDELTAPVASQRRGPERTAVPSAPAATGGTP